MFGGGAWQCFLCGDDPGLEAASSSLVVVVVPCLPVFLLSLRSATCVLSVSLPRVGIDRGEISSAAVGLGLFYELWFEFALECFWGNLSACRRCGSLRSEARGRGPSSESETVSESPCVNLEAMQAVLPLLMPPSVPVPLGGGTLEDDGLGV